MVLPEAFKQRMKSNLEKEYNAFIHTYNEPKVTGLRVNPLKVSRDLFLDIFPYPLEPISFCPTGFYYDAKSIEPGKHPYHQAGLYYIQEPSAMFVAETLAPKPGERVLDLCAAPGGKSTQLAGMMENTGLLISNELYPKRAKALSENIERLGITNTVVTNEAPEKLARKFQGYFDRILVDAPCSGEGMFRKDPDATNYWSLEHVEACALLQKDILSSAYEMLKGGGTLVYSTCTFSPEENEQTVEAFVRKYPDINVLSIDKQGGILPGEQKYTLHHSDFVGNTARLWPHHLKGEGHYVAKLRKTSHTPDWIGKITKSKLTKGQLKDFDQFSSHYLDTHIKENFVINQQQLYSLPDDCPDLRGIKVIRPGLHVGEFKKNRFEPNHALAMSLTIDKVKQSFNLTKDQVPLYLKGETIQTGQDRGWLLVTVDQFPLGWGKESKGTLKNFYPKGLRIHSKSL